jgi:histidinol-phosphate aminotransferase
LLKNRLSEKLDIESSNLIIGNGSTEIIRLAAAAYLGIGDRALILQPTYGEYELAVQLVGAEVIHFKLSEKSDYRLNPDELEKTVKKHTPHALFLCNPNNPSGEYLNKDTIKKIIELSPNCLVVLDEAYVSFVDNPWSSTDLIQYPNLVVIRSMTKDYAMAGVRLGYAFASTGLIATLEKVKPPWNVSALAQAAGCYVLGKSGYVESMQAELVESGEYLKTNLQNMGLRPLPSQANFFLVKVGDAGGLRTALLKKGILVRDCASFGLPEYIRLAQRTQTECEQLITALKEVGVISYGR